MTIEHISIKQLKLLDKNPRKIDKMQFEKLCRSIETDPGFFNDRPCLVNRIGDQLIVYAGNQRLRAAKKLGWKTVPCIIEEITEEVQKRRVVQDNLHQGEFDYDLLSSLYEVGDLIELGFTEEQLSIGNVAVETIEEGEEDESQTLEPGKDEEADTKLGDVYELNGHRIVCGDSTLPEYVQKCLNGAEPILMVTDPPYGVNHDPSWKNEYCVGKRGFSDKSKQAHGLVLNDDQIDWSLAYIQFPGSIAYVWHAGKFGAQVAKHLENCEFEISYQIIWYKQHFSFGRGDYHWHHEPCWYAIKKDHKHNWNGDRKQTTVWEIQNLNPMGKSSTDEKEEKTGHSTQKPLECMARPIRNNTAEGEGVYDPFLGSGTTLIAAENLNRVCYGIELSPAYVDIIVNRWINFMEKNGREYTIRKNGEAWARTAKA